MGFWGKLFGEGPKVKGGYSKDQRNEVMNTVFDKTKQALGNVSAPNQSAFGVQGPGISVGGKSAWGFGNPIFNKAYNPYQFSMPTALNQKTGLFGQLLANSNRELLRNQRASVDNATRAAMRGGVYSPAMMKNTILGAQKASQEAMGDQGTRAAMDMASEMAKYQAEMQNNQAAENRAGRELELRGGQLGLSGEEAAMRGNELDQELKMKDLAQQQDNFWRAMGFGQGSFVDPYILKTQGNKGIFGDMLQAGAGIASKFIP